MSYSNVDFVADQLRAAAPAAEWHMIGVDRDKELAAILVRAGVRDLSRLQLLRVKETRRVASWSEPEIWERLSLSYDGSAPFGFLGTPDRKDATNFLEHDFLVAWSAVGKGHVNYVIQAAPGGFVIVPLWGSSSDWATFRTGVKFLAVAAVSFMLPAAGVAVGQAIGAAVMGPTLAAAYPTVAAAIGNVALSTAFNGGNIEAAVKGSLLSMVGLEAGAFVGQAVGAATNIALIGNLAAVATRATIAGGDVERAIATTLVQNGASSIMEIWQPETLPPESFAPDSFAPDMFAPVSFAPDAGFSFDSFTPGTAMNFTPDPLVFPSTPAFSGGGFSFGDVFSTPTPAQGYGFDVGLIEPAQPVSLDSFGAGTRDVINNISSAALAALQVVKAYRSLDNPQPVAKQARAQLADGTIVSALDSGVIQTTAPDGTVSLTRPGVGQPQSTLSGNVIVNNGDGTYTRISPSGVRSVIKYGNETGGGLLSSLSSIPAPVLAAGAALALFAFRRGRR